MISAERESIILRMGIAFTPGMTAQGVRALESAGVTPEDFFEADMNAIEAAIGRSVTGRLEKLSREEALFRARKEMEFVEKHGIRVYYLGDEDYPMLLREIPDAPMVLFQLGSTDLESEHIMNIVGTRRPTPYAAGFCNRFISDLAGYFPDLVIVSGLAYGVDAMAHNGALENNLRTVAVVAHGLNTIYPAPHRDLARRILQNGGSIISEYPSGTTPYQRRFLERNRIVAGMSEVTVVVESPIRGGAMSTANTAFSYSREVAAVPGRIGDEMSEGCNLLIRKEKAHLLTAAADIVELTGWRPAGVKVTPRQRNLFPELEGIAKEIYTVLKTQADAASLDMLHSHTGIPIPQLMSTLTELEFDGVVIRHPGNRYSIS